MQATDPAQSGACDRPLFAICASLKRRRNKRLSMRTYSTNRLNTCQAISAIICRQSKIQASCRQLRLAQG